MDGRIERKKRKKARVRLPEMTTAGSLASTADGIRVFCAFLRPLRFKRNRTRKGSYTVEAQMRLRWADHVPQFTQPRLAIMFDRAVVSRAENARFLTDGPNIHLTSMGLEIYI